MTQCQMEQEIWGPHEGCSEFMDEPEAVVRCDEPAVVVETWDWYGEVDQKALCAKHRTPERDTTQPLIIDAV